MLHSGPITLASLVGEKKEVDSDDESDDERHTDDKSRRARRGKVGIRNGIASLGGDDYD